jgi:hypothetical protein
MKTNICINVLATRKERQRKMCALDLYLKNTKRPCVSNICCDINTMGVVKHERSFKEVFLHLERSTTSRVFISRFIDTRSRYFALIKYLEAMKCKSARKNLCPLIWWLMLQPFDQSEQALYLRYFIITYISKNLNQSNRITANNYNNIMYYWTYCIVAQSLHVLPCTSAAMWVQTNGGIRTYILLRTEVSMLDTIYWTNVGIFF